ncbi:ATP-dependent nuclease [Pseudoalteromonas rubra]|uniref:ATP-dependent nuclease n=1 Tax=Pseudoalteromonas rubra TaxID=43658 RepID=UPI000F78CF41|nr:AAA family ATPase [Pseudoalteromonas rubra]
MLEVIEIKNFRGFSTHRICFKETSILVGKNNAGKSTIVEALRLVSLVENRFKTSNYSAPPKTINLSNAYKGIKPSVKGLDLNFKSVFHRYGEPPSKIIATFSTGSTIEIYIGLDEVVYGVVKDKNGKIVKSKASAKAVDIPSINALPQIGPLNKTEKILSSEYVKASMNSSLTSLHFRNQLNIYPELIDDFERLCSKTWDSLAGFELLKESSLPGSDLELLVRDKDFVCEVGWTGHGLQMWLQTMWFLARNHNTNTLILDEPDVYMHADLQRKLIRLLKDNGHQVIIATHSVEIMSEVEPGEIVVINKGRKTSGFANTLKSVQQVIDHFGGIHNIEMARLWNSRKLIIVEGKDVGLLKILQDKLYPSSDEPLDIVPSIAIGGWGGWNYAIGSKILIKSTTETISMHCLFDSDYFTDSDIQKRKKEADENNINLHIWARKEIENYFLNGDLIYRYISESCDNKEIDNSVVNIKLNEILEELKDQTFDAIAQHYFNKNKGRGFSNANKYAREVVDEAWSSENGKLNICSGKEVISKMSGWSNEKYGVSFSSKSLARIMTVDEIPKEMKGVIHSLENNSAFT